MPEQDQQTGDNPVAQGRRFRLPKLFADAADSDKNEEIGELETSDDISPRKKLLQSAEALGAKISLSDEEGLAGADGDGDEDAPDTVISRIPTHNVSRETSGAQTPAQDRAPQEAPGEVTTMAQDVAALRAEVEDMSRTLQELNGRGIAQEKVFDTLHSELQDYKNDFIYEHLKPVVRPLLFLFDSLEQFDTEMSDYERIPERERRGGVTPAVIRANIIFFREQLIESLRICEVTPMEWPEGEYDARLHRAVETVPVESEQNNVIQRVIRTGWYLNGRVFRPAEVVIGKTRDDYNSQVWNEGKNL